MAKKDWGDNPIKAHVIFEVVGKPKEHVEATIAQYIEKLGEDEHFEILEEENHEVVEAEKEMFSAFSELRIQTDKLQNIWGLCIDYLPSSIEIEEPEQLILKNHQVSDLSNDFINQVHRVDLVLKTSQQKNKLLAQNIGTLIQNSILLALQLGPQTIESLKKAVGVQDDEIQRFLDHMQKNDRIKKEGDKYTVVRDNGAKA